MRNRMVLAASLLSLDACSADEGVREYRTAYATIDTTFDEPLCVADLELVDRHVEQIAALLGVEPLSETDHLVELEAGPHEVVFFASPGVEEETLHVQLSLEPPE